MDGYYNGAYKCNSQQEYFKWRKVIGRRFHEEEAGLKEYKRRKEMNRNCEMQGEEWLIDVYGGGR